MGDDKGSFYMARTVLPPAVEAEATALREAVTWISNLNLQNVIIELCC